MRNWNWNWPYFLESLDGDVLVEEVLLTPSEAKSLCQAQRWLAERGFPRMNWHPFDDEMKYTSRTLSAGMFHFHQSGNESAVQVAKRLEHLADRLRRGITKRCEFQFIDYDHGEVILTSSKGGWTNDAPVDIGQDKPLDFG